MGNCHEKDVWANMILMIIPEHTYVKNACTVEFVYISKKSSTMYIAMYLF